MDCLSWLLTLARPRLDTPDYLLLQASVAFWDRYEQFLEAVVARYELASCDYLAASDALRPVGEADSAGSYSLGPDGYTKLAAVRLATLRLHLEIESFYLFAKILLDRVADTWRHVFEQRWKGFGSTHSKLTRHLDSQTSAGNGPADLVLLRDLAHDLKVRIVEFRNTEIEHQDDSEHRVPGASWGAGRRVCMMYATVVPDSRTGTEMRDRSTEDPVELLSQLRRYMDAVACSLMAHIGNTTSAPTTP